VSGTLVLCGAPIGDLRDASPRIAEVLATADVIAAEDTRRVLRLAHGLGVTITGRIMSCYDAVEGARAAQLTDYLRQGATVALVTDAGMPAVSDPGFRVVAAAAAAGMTVTVVPGPSAVTAALAVSGLPSDRWTFEGFLPRRGGERRARLRELAGEPRTMVFLESPHRVAGSLRDLLAVFGADRPAVLCRELTKTYEEIVRGDLAAIGAWAGDGRVIRGEFTLVVAGAPRRQVIVSTSGAADLTSAPALGGAARVGDTRVGQTVVETMGVGAGGEAAVAESAVVGAASVGAPGAGEASVGASAAGAGETGTVTVSAATLAADVERRTAAGMSRNQARREVATEHGVSRNDVYAAELAVRPPRR
jgi:16S rRNA (cytidine1402-2'-O)-methyltransferase